MRKHINLTAFAFLAVCLVISSVSAISVDRFDNVNLVPGGEGRISVEVKNTLDYDIINVVLDLDLKNLPFIALSGSSDSVDEIREGDEKGFSFQLRASTSGVAGDYSIPYTLEYLDTNTDKVEKQTGTIGVTIEADPEFDISVNVDKPVVGENAIVTLKIINNGLADARFVSVETRAKGYTLLSDGKQYIGTVSSDDFETVNFDVKFTSDEPRFSATVTYRDFDNREKSFEIDESINLYSREKAIELGIISKSNTFLYIIIIVLLIVVFFVWRYAAKRRRVRRSMNNS